MAFGGQRNVGSPGYAILYGSGGPLTVVADTSVQTQWDFVNRPSINNANAVAFGARPAGAPSVNTVIRADGATFTTIAEPGMSVPGGGPIHEAYEPALNNAGQVEFSVNTTTAVGNGIYRAAGGPLTRIVAGAGNAFSGINDAGRVAFASGNLVKSGAGGALTTIALPGSTFQSFTGVAAINNANAVAFGALTTSGKYGVFVGDGVVTQKVVQVGDVIPGLGVVTSVGMTEEAINDSGQVAFGIQYNDGGGTKAAIVRADPILPEITQLKFAATVAGGCKKVSATVTLDRPAPPGGVLIDIGNTNPAATAPATLAIASNKTSGKFVITTTAVAANQVGDISVDLGASSQTKQLTVRRIGVLSLTLSPNPGIGGNVVNGTVKLECDAAPGDITVTLSSSNPSAAQPATASLLIPAGTRTMPFQVNTSAVAAPSKAKITATANGIGKNKTLTVNP